MTPEDLAHLQESVRRAERIGELADAWTWRVMLAGAFLAGVAVGRWWRRHA